MPVSSPTVAVVIAEPIFAVVTRFVEAFATRKFSATAELTEPFELLEMLRFAVSAPELGEVKVPVGAKRFPKASMVVSPDARLTAPVFETLKSVVVAV